MKYILACLIALISIATSASEVEVLDVTATQSGGIWRFDVTLRHDDTGWDHYADGWRVLSMDGAELGTRVLVHPHVNEMPFTRSLGGVEIPEGMTRVLVVAKDNLGDWGTQNYEVNLLGE
ncbi:MAG: hypothetical protein L3J33_09490 [Rhodobacteraceae bacterium]|nr:hypothetical protein [Paracoccaceae bacterium]